MTGLTWRVAAPSVGKQVGVPLILTGPLPNLVVRASGTPYVSRGQLRFKLNPNASTETQ